MKKLMIGSLLLMSFFCRGSEKAEHKKDTLSPEYAIILEYLADAIVLDLPLEYLFPNKMIAEEEDNKHSIVNIHALTNNTIRAITKAGHLIQWDINTRKSSIEVCASVPTSKRTISPTNHTKTITLQLGKFTVEIVNNRILLKSQQFPAHAALLKQYMQ